MSSRKRKLADYDESALAHKEPRHSVLDGNITVKMKESNSTDGDIDEGLYSRMLYVMGADGLRRMAKSSVLISGMRGLGVEIAKNLILGGMKFVLLHDSGFVSLADLSTQYFLKKEDIGKNRAEVCCPLLAELNNYVKVDFFSGTLTFDIVRQFQVLVLTEIDGTDESALAEFCHSSGIHFISACTCGLAGKIFCDFGENFKVVDPDGEEPITNIVSSITNDENGVVTVLDEQRHGYEDGAYVRFSEIKGMTELNDHEPFKIKVLGNYTFSIGDCSKYSLFEGTGLVTEVKMPINMSFKPLKQAIAEPEFLQWDFAKLGVSAQLHIAFLALNEFLNCKRRFPLPFDENDAKAFCEISNMINNTHKFVEELDENLMKTFAMTCSGELIPINAFIGGITAQEVMKACTSKFVPIHQFLYFESFECIQNIPSKPYELLGSRYDKQVMIFGPEFQKKLQTSKVFVVGAGALGCEILKNFAMMGVGCSADGKVFVTDMDVIEKSNLNRQFLFRSWDIQKLKSEVAANAVRKMNPEINIEAQHLRVGPETEDYYDDAFFENLDVVVNALDNVDSRNYIDRRCVYYRKPLLESGTLGTKANVQVILPFLTESYSSSHDPPEKSIPVCTLKNFPNSIEHTLQWARDAFEGLFCNPVKSTLEFIRNPEEFKQKMKSSRGAIILNEIITVRKTLLYPKSFEECVAWARNLFEHYFVNQIKQLLFNFPPDMLTSSGVPFWSGPKRCPHPLIYDPIKNPTHGEFVYAAANLYAFMYNMPQLRDRKTVIDMSLKVKVDPFIPRSGVKIAVTDNEETSQNSFHDPEDVEKEINSLPPAITFSELRLNPIEFEKDDDTNLHMNFITSCSNLRAENYDIQPADMSKSKLIAGRIIPAIATTTSMVVGLVCLELYKVLHGYNKLELFKNAYINLSTPFFTFSEPFRPATSKFYDREFSLWDRIDVQGDMTLGEFLEYLEKEYKIKVNILSHGVMMLYSFFMAKDKVQERMAMTIPQIVESVTKKPIPSYINALVLELSASDVNDEELEVPYIRYVLKKNKC